MPSNHLDDDRKKDNLAYFLEKYHCNGSNFHANKAASFEEYFTDFCNALDVPPPESEGPYCFNKKYHSNDTEQPEKYCDVWYSDRFEWRHIRNHSEVSSQIFEYTHLVLPFVKKPPLLVLSTRLNVVVLSHYDGHDFGNATWINFEHIEDPHIHHIARCIWEAPWFF